MTYDINAALERLENNLREVESAKRQVEETIASSQKLQKIIGGYSDNLRILHNEISSFVEEVHNFQNMKTEQMLSSIDNIRASCDSVTEDFCESVNTATDNFDTKVNTVIQNFNSENGRLSGQVDRLISLQDILSQATNKVNEVKDDISILAHNLKSSQDEQDRELANIKSSLEVFPSEVMSHKNAIISKLNSQTSELKDKNDEINTKISQAIGKLDNIISALNGTKNICNGIDLKVESLKSTLDSRLSNEESAIKLNRWILIIGIFVLIALHFI